MSLWIGGYEKKKDIPRTFEPVNVKLMKMKPVNHEGSLGYSPQRKSHNETLDYNPHFSKNSLLPPSPKTETVTSRQQHNNLLHLTQYGKIHRLDLIKSE